MHYLPNIARTYPDTVPWLEGPTNDPQPAGTMRAWFEAHDGAKVTTIQSRANGTWAPTGRTVDASRATYVQLDGSRRDYRGCAVAHADDRVLIVTTDDDTTEIAYYVE